ncbi:SDR family NAD(P)-dependent oxidoreductase [Streptomyces sp. NBC_00057]|uniref:SDR family NAD(P)-dependent oxidoreductase n=1 Tax=Streptomyces sp. NBC_00057 TaxID=2975634 RepID=UPI003862FE3E
MTAPWSHRDLTLVTGRSRGIGLMITRALAEAGARVYVSSRNAVACEEAVRELSAREPLHTGTARRGLCGGPAVRDSSTGVRCARGSASRGPPARCRPPERTPPRSPR